MTGTAVVLSFLNYAIKACQLFVGGQA